MDGEVRDLWCWVPYPLGGGQEPLTREFLYDRERPRPLIGKIPTFPLQPRAAHPS